MFRRIALAPIGLIEEPKNKKLVFASDESNEPISFDYNPDNFVYFRCRAITADEPNGNGDFFPEAEIRKAYKSFVGVGLYKDHQSDSVDKSIGKVLWAEWVPNGRYVECYCAVDKHLAPDLAHRVKMGIATSVSMGCSVQEAECSICHNIAHNVNELCSHMAPGFGQKGRKAHDGKVVYEINRGIQFNELSLVTVPADPTARIFEIYASLKKRAEDSIPALKEIYIALGIPGMLPEEEYQQEEFENRVHDTGRKTNIRTSDKYEMLVDEGKRILSSLDKDQKIGFKKWIAESGLNPGLLGLESSISDLPEYEGSTHIHNLWYVPSYDLSDPEAVNFFRDISDMAVKEDSDGVKSTAKEMADDYYAAMDAMTKFRAPYGSTPYASLPEEVKKQWEDLRLEAKLRENKLLGTYPRVWGKMARAYDRYKDARASSKAPLSQIVEQIESESPRDRANKEIAKTWEKQSRAFVKEFGGDEANAGEMLKAYFNEVNESTPDRQLPPGPFSPQDAEKIFDLQHDERGWWTRMKRKYDEARELHDLIPGIQEATKDIPDTPYSEMNAPKQVDPQKQKDQAQEEQQRAKRREETKVQKVDDATKVLERQPSEAEPAFKAEAPREEAPKEESPVGEHDSVLEQLFKVYPPESAREKAVAKGIDEGLIEQFLSKKKEKSINPTSSNNKVVIKIHNSLEDGMGLSIGYLKGANLDSSFFEAKEKNFSYRVAASDVLPIVVQEAITQNDPRVATPDQIVSDLATRFSTLDGFKKWAKKRKKKNKKALLRMMPKEDLAKKMIEPKSDPVESVDKSSGMDTVNGRNNEMKDKAIPKSAAQEEENPTTPVTETPKEEATVNTTPAATATEEKTEATPEVTPETKSEVRAAFESLISLVNSKLGTTATQVVKMEAKVDGVGKSSAAPEPKGAIKEVTKTENPKGHVATSSLKAEAMDENWTVNNKELEKEPKSGADLQVSVDEKEMSSEEVSVKNSNQHAGKVKKYFGRLGPGAEGTPEVAMDLKSSENSEVKMLREALAKEQAAKEALLEKEKLQAVADKIFNIVATLREKNLIAAGKEEVVIDTLTQKLADANTLEGLSAVVENLEAQPEAITEEGDSKVVPQTFDTTETPASNDPVSLMSDIWNK